jgi:two-component system cell cycle sensor histidine kinase/response regulator CckA
MEKSDTLASFAEWNPNPIIELTLDGSIVYVNLVARTLFPDLLTQGLSHPILSDLKKIIADFQLTGGSEIIVYNQDVTHNKKCYEEQIFSLNDSRIYVYIIDVTERNQLKKQAQFSDKLATIGMLAAGVAHEINNPITWILGNLSLLENYANTLISMSADPNQKELVAKIQDIANESLLGMEQIRDITKSLKELARIDKAAMVPVELDKILNMTITMAALEFKTKAYLERNFAEKLPLVISHSGKLHQVFLNLLINAAHAIPEGDIQHNRIIVSTQVEKNQVRVDIKDTGQGMSPEVLSKIFEPFFTTKTSRQGTGLGLSICHDIMRELQGEIRVVSREGEGSTFSVYLPVQPKVLKEVAEAEKITVYSKKKSILIVDNEPILLKLLHRILLDQHQVTMALGGNEAKELINENPESFDLIITDLNMPEFSGADLYRYAAKKFPGLERKFIFITGGIEMPWVKEFLIKAGNPILEKPFLPKDVLNLIAKTSVQS